jgi:UDP-2,3-diacylglucosamine pyrophosphatase LpxH
MLLVVSDLHLLDSNARGSPNFGSLFSDLDASLGGGNDEQCTLVLLGDIFELLKSDLWFDSPHRPWHEPTQGLIETVLNILKGIYESNVGFFSTINRLCQERGLKLLYVPGNHDGLMFSRRMGPVRAALRQYLPALSSDDPEAMFPESLMLQDYGTYLEHGHEFDEFNRSQGSVSRVIPGDVVVVEIVARIAAETARLLGSTKPLVDQYSDELHFLQCLDDVVPQDANSLLAWMRSGLSSLQEPRRSDVEKALCDAIGRCLERAAAAIGKDSKAAVLYKAFGQTFRYAIQTGRLRLARRVANFVSPNNVSEIHAIERTASKINASVYPDSPSVKIIVAGHTHVPTHWPIVQSSGTITYLNSGTWRRVLLCRPDGTGIGSFAEYYEAVVVCIYKRDCANKPNYDYRRRTFSL